MFKPWLFSDSSAASISNHVAAILLSSLGGLAAASFLSSPCGAFSIHHFMIAVSDCCLGAFCLCRHIFFVLGVKRYSFDDLAARPGPPVQSQCPAGHPLKATAMRTQKAFLSF
jgi:hypothetical protein